MSSLLLLYPATWRARYGDEMDALLGDRPPGYRERFDLIRGAIDAWLHPPAPSRTSFVAALLGGGSWTAVAAGVLVQPAPPDWPGYLMETVPIALMSAVCLLVASAGCLLRAGETSTRTAWLTIGLVAVGYLAWIGLLGATLLGLAGGWPLAAAQTVAMLGTIATGLVLVRAGVEAVGSLLFVAALAMLMPWTLAWLGFGTAWTAIGIALFLDRAERMESGGGAVTHESS